MSLTPAERAANIAYMRRLAATYRRWWKTYSLDGKHLFVDDQAATRAAWLAAGRFSLRCAAARLRGASR